MIPTQTNGRVSTVQEASAAKLLALLRHPADAVVAEVASGFVALQRLVASLPLTTDEFCFAHNWLTSAQDLWQAGDSSAAHYQVALVVRKLEL
jgi:hypothetical protein